MKKILAATVFLSFINSAFAQVYNCNGVYTTSPCTDKAKEVGTPIAAKGVSQDSEEKKALSRKKSITHDLAMKAANANRDYKLNYNIDAVEDFCFEPETSLQACAKKADEMAERIDDRVASIETIKAQKKANELQELKIQQEIEDDDVLIVQQYYEVTPTFDHRRPPYYRPDRPEHRPVKQPINDPSAIDKKPSDNRRPPGFNDPSAVDKTPSEIKNPPGRHNH